MLSFDCELTRRAALLSAAGAAIGFCSGRAGAAEIIRALVGFPPGGAIDTTARVYADAMKDLGTIIIDNKPGAAGNIAGSALAQSKPDGTTMMFAPVNVYCISPTLYKSLPFSPDRDFEPVGVVATFPWALAVHPSVPANSIPEFVAWAKSKQEPALCGMAAIGSEGHLMAYSFSKAAGIPMQFVAYKGGAPMAQDLMAGNILIAFDPIVNMGPPYKAGKVKVLAVTGRQRTLMLPGTPTFQELGYASMTGETWIGVGMRKGTSTTTVQRLADALAAASRVPAVRDRLAAAGLTAQSSTPAEMAALIVTDSAHYSKLVREMALQVD